MEGNDDIYVDAPVSTTTTTTTAAPSDPSISSRPKNNQRSTSFFAQPGTLAGKSFFFLDHHGQYIGRTIKLCGSLLIKNFFNNR
jgi:hypothetical protein